MKIAFILSAFPTLTEMGVLNQITGLLDEGHDVRIFARAPLAIDAVHPDVEQYGLMERVSYFAIPAGKPARVLRAAGLAGAKLFTSPATVFNSLNAFKYGTPALSMTLLFAAFAPPANDFDVIHGHFGPNGIIAEFLRSIGVPGGLVASFHGHDASRYPRTAGKHVYDRMFANADAVTANTVFLKEKVVGLGCEPGKIEVIPSAIRVDRFEFRQRTAWRGEPVRILTVGRLVEKKGYEYALRATALLAAKFCNIEYIIVGDGPLRADLERLARDLRIERIVQFAGRATQDSVLGHYNRSDIFLMPSVTARDVDHEGQGLTLQEAQAAGLPVVSTLHNGIPEGCLDGTSAFLVPERDTQGLYVALARLLEHPETWAAMGRAGRNFVAVRYDVPVVTRRLVELYESILDRGPGVRTKPRGMR